ncbi:MAG: NHLP leader peptide family RiPP precursor [Candidatus Eremiobacterota bacterium]
MKENVKKMGQVFAKCWADEEFKKKFKADPLPILKEHGIEVPQGVKVNAYETTDKEFHIVIPPKPSKEIADEQLDKVAAGGTWGTIGSACIATAGTAYCH